MYSIPDLQTFVSVAHSGGITAAARRLGISAATTSHRIAKLEQVLSLRLFHRNSRSFELTDEGHVFLERVETILSDLQQAELEAGGGTAQLRGHLRITMSPWILTRFILPQLPAFRRQNPDLTLEFLAVDRFVPLVEEGQDCAIRVGALPDSALVAAKLADNDRILCASPDFLQRNGTPNSFEALQDADWVCLPWQTQFDIRQKDAGRRKLRAVHKVMVSNSDMLTDAAVQGMGLAVKSRLAVKTELDSGALIEVMPKCLTAPEAPIWFVTPPDSRHSRKTREFGKVARLAFDVL